MGKFNFFAAAILLAALAFGGCEDSNTDSVNGLQDIGDISGYYALRSITFDGGSGSNTILTNFPNPDYMRGFATLEEGETDTAGDGDFVMLGIDGDDLIMDDGSTLTSWEVEIINDGTRLLATIGEDTARVFSFVIDVNAHTLTLNLDPEAEENLPIEEGDIRQIVLELEAPPSYEIEGLWEGHEATIDGDTIELDECIDDGADGLVYGFEMGFDDDSFAGQEEFFLAWEDDDQCSDEPDFESDAERFGFYEVTNQSLRWWLVNDEDGDDPMYLQFTVSITYDENEDRILTLSRTGCSDTEGECDDFPTHLVMHEELP